MVATATTPPPLPAPQYEYVGSGIHKIKVVATVNHEAIKLDFMHKIETDGVQLVRKVIVDQAKALRYDSPESLCSYAGYINSYQKEAMSFIAWRGAVWDWTQKYISDVAGGAVVPPSNLSDLVAMMPKYTNYIVI